MQRMTIALVVFAASCASPIFAECPGSAPAGNLMQELQATYVPTLMDPTGIKVAQPGCTLVVQLDGIAACPSAKTIARSVYENGQVSPESKNGTVNKIKRFSRLPGLGGAPSDADVPDIPTCGPTSTPRNFMVGEKVYLTNMVVKNTGNDTGLIFDLQSCGTCDPSAADPSHTPYKAQLRISLLKNFLTATNLKQIEAVVGKVLAFPEDAAQDNQQQVSQNGQAGGAAPSPSTAPQQAPPQTFAPIAPPPPPDTPAAPAANLTGQTPDQVKAALGEPSGVVKAGNKQIYTYKNLSLKVVFTDGKVTDVE